MNTPIQTVTGDISYQPSPYGHFGCDSPKKLVDLVMTKMKDIQPDTDIILVSGDYLAHGFSVDTKGQPHYELLKQTIQYVFVDLLSSHFPNAIILPSIGNNDIKYHYLAPTQEDEASDYYNFFADVLFNQVPGNKKLKLDLLDSILTNGNGTSIVDDKDSLAYPNWAETFLSRGYFRYDHDFGPDGDGFYLSFISLNTLYYSLGAPFKQADIMKQQLDWLEQQLRTSEDDRKFVIYFHIFPGEFQVSAETYFWDDESTSRFSSIMDQYGDRISTLLGAHTHLADLRVNVQPPTKDVPNPTSKVVLLVTPSISPQHLNNPGFTVFTIENNVAKNAKFVFFELFKLPRTEGEATFNELDFATEMGIDTITPKKVQAFIQNLSSSTWSFYRYLAHKLGYTGLVEPVGVALHMKLGSVGFSSSQIFV